MKYMLGLSAEDIQDRLGTTFSGVGMIRGEYLCRKIGKYVPVPECRRFIAEYLDRIATMFSPDPVWYRTTELETAEVNVLEGADQIIEEKTTMMGYRGIRRALLHPETFRLEVETVVEVAARRPNLHALLPFVATTEEFEFARDCFRSAGFENQLGMMVEIPSAVLCLKDFIALGARHLTIGMNDLTSLALGAYRGSGMDRHLHPAVKMLVMMARDAAREHGVSVAIAGYLTPETLEFARAIELDAAILHYSKLPELLGPEWESLPHRENLQAIKRQTRAQISERNDRLVLERLGLNAVGAQP